MKIAILTERMLSGYGVEITIDKIAQGLVLQGFDTEVLCCFGDGSYEGREYRLRNLNVPTGNSPADYERNAYLAAVSALREKDLLVVEAYPFFYTGACIALRTKKPWIAVDHGVVPSELVHKWKQKEFDYIRNKQYHEYFPLAARIVCVSNWLREQLPKGLQGKAEVIYNGVDHYGERRLVDIKDVLAFSGTLLLYVGRSVDTAPYKNVDVLLDCFSSLRTQIPNIGLLIVGAIGFEEKQRLAEKGAYVITGVHETFLSSIYSSCDLYATASKWEGFDLPLMEASYYGRPGVAFSTGAHPELIRDKETGLLASNDLEFQQNLRRLIEDVSLRDRLGKAAQQIVKNQFTWDRSVRRYIEAISSVR